MSDDKRVVDINPAPSDEELIDFFKHKYEHAKEEIEDYLEVFKEEVLISQQDGEPIEFVYARLLRDLAGDAPKAIRMLSALIFYLET